MKNRVDFTPEDFFIPQNKVYGISDEDYKQLGLLIDAVEAFERSTNHCIFIIDYYRRGFLYVSRNVEFVCGVSAEELKESGYNFYIDHVPEEDLMTLIRINEAAFNFFNSIPLYERTRHLVSYDLHMKLWNKRWIVHHQVTPISMTADGKLWLALCSISLSSEATPGNVRIRKDGAEFYHEYSFENNQWEQKPVTAFSEMERGVLTLSAQGYTMTEIADRLCRSVDTIKFYKRSLFDKIGVKNITEAVIYAQNHKLV